MYKTRINRVNFFTPRQYERLPIKHLSLKDYRQFIYEVNKELGVKNILESREGFLLPDFLGLIKVRKTRLTKGIYTIEKVTKYKGEQKEYNHHTFGYIYRISWIKTVRADKRLKPKYKSMNIQDLGILRFKAHRHNLKRPLNKILKRFERDYDETGKEY